MNINECSHESSSATRLAGDPVAGAWECDECGHLRPFVDADFAFVNAYAWLPPRVPGKPFAPASERYAYWSA